ncbi:hypothetical protein CsSME_00038233 [Camellia sinensis var. sinensis]
MKQQSSSIFILGSILILLLFWQTTSVKAQEVEDENEFDYAKGSEKGPERWGEIKEEWAACDHGEMQSPIDMVNRRVKIIRKSREFVKNYKPSNATVKNRGHDISVQWTVGEAGSIKINGTEYQLQQGHWHSPSEHSINGRRYAMELHLVHVNPQENGEDKIAVIGVLYRIGRPDSFLSQLPRNILDMIDMKEERHSGVIDPREIKMGGKRYYRYMGSLTVPPCTEGVVWTINKKYAEENARPLQPLHDREIYLYKRP